LSIGRETTKHDVDVVVDDLKQAVSAVVAADEPVKNAEDANNSCKATASSAVSASNVNAEFLPSVPSMAPLQLDAEFSAAVAQAAGLKDEAALLSPKGASVLSQG